MRTLLKPLFAASCLFALAGPAAAQVTQKAYAPERLHGLSREDQARVIRLEYREQSGGRRIPDDQLRFYLDQVNRSDWGFSQVKDDIARSLGHGRDRPGPGWSHAIRCESADNRSRSCPTPWPGRSRVSRQLSDTRCEEGRNWSSQRGQVNVWAGCRAEFVAERGAGPGAGNLVCESIDNRSRRCATPWRGPSYLLRQLSDTDCIEGRNWRSRDGEVTVWSGCRAEFGPLAAVPGGGWNGGGYSVTCASEDGRYRTCHWAPGQGRPRLLQQLSRQACIEGRTWGRADRNTIWVDGGCRARFGN